jgi:hypothetical protein
MKMKKTTWCARRCLDLLARRNGRISTMDAPVVPIKFASTAPIASMPVFESGVPFRDPLR